MNSSTLRRSNITKEKIAMLNAISDYSSTGDNKYSFHSDRQAELDMLWQNFKIAATSNKNPKTYFSVGFFIGIVASLIVATVISFFIGYSPLSNINLHMPKINKESVKYTFVPADKQLASETTAVNTQEKEYTVQAGDSLEDICVRFYGHYDESKIKEIQVRNSLKDINSIKIGQVLYIPMNQ